MAPPSPTQLVLRGRIEAVLRVVAPALDLVLAAGDRVSRAVDRDEPETALPPTAGTVIPPRRRVGMGSESARSAPARDER